MGLSNSVRETMYRESNVETGKTSNANRPLRHTWNGLVSRRQLSEEKEKKTLKRHDLKNLAKTPHISIH